MVNGNFQNFSNPRAKIYAQKSLTIIHTAIETGESYRSRFSYKSVKKHIISSHINNFTLATYTRLVRINDLTGVSMHDDTSTKNLVSRSIYFYKMY